MGVWALVLAILPLCITWLVSIGLAVAVLLRPDDGWRRGRGPAIAALAISSVWILVVSGLLIAGRTLPEPEAESAASSKNDSDRSPTPTRPSPGDVKSDALEVGDCLPKVPSLAWPFTVKVAPCSDPHRAEVYAVWDHGPQVPIPSAKQVGSPGRRGLLETFKPFIGDGYYSVEPGVHYLMPDEGGLGATTRASVTCVVYDKAPTHRDLAEL